MPSYLNLEMRLRRMTKRLDELQQWLAREVVVLNRWTLQGQPIAAGHRWQDNGDPLPFDHPSVEVPAHWPLQDTRLHLWLGGEGLVRLKGKTTTTHGLNPPHMDFRVTDRVFSIEADCVGQPDNRPPTVSLTNPGALATSRTGVAGRSIERPAKVTTPPSASTGRVSLNLAPVPSINRRVTAAVDVSIRSSPRTTTITGWTAKATSHSPVVGCEVKRRLGVGTEVPSSPQAPADRVNANDPTRSLVRCDRIM